VKAGVSIANSVAPDNRTWLQQCLQVATIVCWLVMPCSAGEPTGMPPQLVFSTYLGGSQEDTIRDITTDIQGNIYVTGGTASPNFPVTAGSYDTTFNGWHDVFVAKLDPNGHLLWCTFIGGRNYDRAYAIELDNLGYIYIAGRAGPGFPTTAGAFQTTYQGFYTGRGYGDQNAFVAKLKPDGSGLVWASYFGPFQLIRDLAIDHNGDISVAAMHEAAETATAPAEWFTNAFQKAPKGPNDAVIARIKSDGSRVLWASFFGGSSDEGGGPSIRVDDTGHPYFLGATSSTDLPTTMGAYSRTYNGGKLDLFLVKFTPDGSQLVFSTYLGGSGDEGLETHELALDAQGNSYISSWTSSSDFPTTPGAFQTTYPGGPSNTFVAKISVDGTRLLASTFIGGAQGELTEGIAVDTHGDVFIVGNTASGDFPTTRDALQAAHKGSTDFFAVKLSSDFSHLLYSTYCGGSNEDNGRSAHVDASGNMYMAGMTKSTDWPTLNAYQAAHSGNWDGALAKFSLGVGQGQAR
jgi:beta-propeller repeat-containing protein